jgi:hypothetical protein
MRKGTRKARAALRPRISTPASTRLSTESALNPPSSPDTKGLPVRRRLTLRKQYEKQMYKYIITQGSASLEACGPCDRTKKECIRLPGFPKCALCLRGHDVCEMWDETVESSGRRRVGKRVTEGADKKVSIRLNILMLD